LIRNWKKRLEQEGFQAFPGPGNRSPLEAELKRLRGAANKQRFILQRNHLSKEGLYVGFPGMMVVAQSDYQFSIEEVM
jgi:hypothetical protein